MKAKDVGVAISKVLQFLPYSISTLPYDYSLEIVKSTFRDLNLELWPRNGYALRTLTPGASDLDLTVLAFQNDEELFRTFSERYSNMKRCLPFLGEVNWLDGNSLEDFLEFLNPMEALRDPVLRSLSSYSRKCSTAHRICFFLRCLASDTYGIRTDFSSRKRKWNRHLIDLGFSEFVDKFNSPAEIFDLCEQKLLVENLPGYERGFLGKLIQNHHSDINAWNRFYSSTNVRDFLLLAPNRWLGATLHYNNINEDLKLMDDFSRLEKDLFVAQIEWEIWGLYTQLHMIADKEGLKRHLENFKIVSDYLTCAPHLSKGFESLLETHI